MQHLRHALLVAASLLLGALDSTAQQVLDSNHSAVVQFLTTHNPSIVPPASAPYTTVTDATLPSGTGILIDCTVVQDMLTQSLATADAYLEKFKAAELTYVGLLQQYLLEPTPALKAQVDAAKTKMELFAHLHHAFDAWSWACDTILRAAGC